MKYINWVRLVGAVLLVGAFANGLWAEAALIFLLFFAIR